MIKPKRSVEQQVADETDRRALNPLASRQTISDSQAEPEFQANHKRLRAERLAREAGLNAKKMSETPKENEIRHLLSRAWSRRRRKADVPNVRNALHLPPRRIALAQWS